MRIFMYESKFDIYCRVHLEKHNFAFHACLETRLLPIWVQSLTYFALRVYSEEQPRGCIFLLCVFMCVFIWVQIYCIYYSGFILRSSQGMHLFIVCLHVRLHISPSLLHLLLRVYSEEQPGDAATALFIKQLSEEDAGQYRSLAKTKTNTNTNTSTKTKTHKRLSSCALHQTAVRGGRWTIQVIIKDKYNGDDKDKDARLWTLNSTGHSRLHAPLYPWIISLHLVICCGRTWGQCNECVTQLWLSLSEKTWTFLRRRPYIPAHTRSQHNNKLSAFMPF